jgi:ABC-type Fe3+-siderophore transport system permease subunit
MVMLSLLVGGKPIPAPVVFDSLFGSGAHPDAVLVLQGRLPRTLLGLLAGAALGVAGALIQALTRNPLADAGLLGVNAGASFAIVLGVSVFSVTAPLAMLWLAFGGALFTSILVYVLGAFGAARVDSMRFVLAGIAISAVLMGLASGMTLLDPVAFDRVRFWNAGSLDVRALGPVWLAAPAIGLGCVLALALARPLNALGLGQDLALALGSRPALVQGAALLAIALLCGASTAAAGPIGFVGLMIPHVSRALAGSDLRANLPCTLLLAPTLLLAADIVGRVLVAGELRVSIVTALVGAPMLIWLVRRGGAP